MWSSCASDVVMIEEKNNRYGAWTTKTKHTRGIRIMILKEHILCFFEFGVERFVCSIDKHTFFCVFLASTTKMYHMVLHFVGFSETDS